MGLALKTDIVRDRKFSTVTMNDDDPGTSGIGGIDSVCGTGRLGRAAENDFPRTNPIGDRMLSTGFSIDLL